MRSTGCLFSAAVLSVLATQCGRGEEPNKGPQELQGVAAIALPTEGPATVRDLGSHLAARFDRAAVEVELGKRATDGFRVEARRGFDLRVSSLGVEPAAATVARGLVRYDGAYGEGTEMVHRMTAKGTEDYVRFTQAPARAELRYRVALGRDVAGLRLVGRTLEFLDASGTPRLRMDPPAGTDASGHTFAANVAVEGCAVDTSPRAPWGRTPVSPGADACTVRVGWDARIAYPAVIDPAWVSAGDLSASTFEWENWLVALSNGYALAVPDGVSAQIFDPATNTWAATGGLPGFALTHRSRLIALGAGGAFAASNGGPTAIYDVAQGTWSPEATLPGHDGNGIALTDKGDGTILVFDASLNVWSYDPATDTYTPKTGGGAGIAANPGAWRLGGTNIGVAAEGSVGAGIQVAIYDYAADAWDLTHGENVWQGSSAMANCGNLELLSDGRVLAFGGGGGPNLATLWDIANKTATPVAISNDLPMWHLCHHTASVAFGTKHLIGGGRWLYDEVAGDITDLGAFASGAVIHGSVVKLNDGRALAAGGAKNLAQDMHNALTDVYSPSSSDDCGGAVFGAVSSPVFDAASKSCKACDADNGGGGLACPTAAAPACQTGNGNALLGQCTECSATEHDLCTGTKPTCDTTTGACAACTAGNGVANAVRACGATTPVCAGTGACVVADGDNGTNATAPCPTAAAPFLKGDGTCGTCTDNASCAGAAHAGPICNPTTGACGTTCDANADCAATQFCALPAGTCTPKKDLGGTCTDTAQCAAGTCVNGVCATASSGTDAGAPADAGSENPPTKRPNSGEGGGGEGDVPTTEEDGGNRSTGGGGCNVANEGSGFAANAGLAAALAGLFAFRTRRRRAK